VRRATGRALATPEGLRGLLLTGAMPPPTDGPGRRGPVSLGGELAATGLPDDATRRDGPPRDQGPSPSWVAVAACAALEASGAVAPGLRLCAAFLYRRRRARPIDAPGAALRATRLGTAAAVLAHAVCILGFQPAPEEALGGWFIFRNSLGLRFAENAPDAARRRADGTPRTPFVPDNGYALSASHLEAHLWEILAPAPP